MGYTVSFIATVSYIGWLIRRVDVRGFWDRLACVDPLRIDQALAGPPQPRRRVWGVRAQEPAVAAPAVVVRDWQRDADLHEVA